MRPPAAAADIEHILAQTAALWEPLRGARIFITGGTGFVGTWLLEALVAGNAAYALGVGLVVLTRDPRAFRSRSPHLASAPAVTLLRGNTADFVSPPGPFTHVIHAATERYYLPDAARPLGILADDALATRRVLDLAVTSGAHTLLFTSSGSVYGPQPANCAHLRESDAFAPDPTDPKTLYGQSKRLSEFTCIMHGSAFGFAAKIARLFAFVGPHLPLDAGYAAGNFLRDVLAGGPIRIAGDGTALRSYLYAADLAVWLLHILVRGAGGRAYNVGSPHAISITGLAQAVVAATGSQAQIEIARTPVAGLAPPAYVPCTQRAERELGLRPAIGLCDALSRTYAWLNSGAGIPLTIAF